MVQQCVVGCCLICFVAFNGFIWLAVDEIDDDDEMLMVTVFLYFILLVLLMVVVDGNDVDDNKMLAYANHSIHYCLVSHHLV